MQGAANENDRNGAKLAIKNMITKYSNVKKMWADMGYLEKDLKASLDNEFGIDLKIIKRPRCRFWARADVALALLPKIEKWF